MRHWIGAALGFLVASCAARALEAQEDSVPLPEREHRGRSDFVDTRLAWTFGDDDVLHASGDTIPLSPAADIGNRAGYELFYDNLNSRFDSRENVTHLVLYHSMPGYLDAVVTEASLALRLNMDALANSGRSDLVLEDAGSFIGIMYEPVPSIAVGLTLFPIDADRFRLGYLYDLSWGGSNARINESIFPRIRGGAPGAKLELRGPTYSAFVGMKTARLSEVEDSAGAQPGGLPAGTTRVDRTNYGILAGAALDLTPVLHFTTSGGFFEQGKLEQPDVLGRRAHTYGISARLVVHQDLPVPRSIDVLLYRNDPDAPLQWFQPTGESQAELAWAVTLEATELRQRLKDFDESGATETQPARAAALLGDIEIGRLRTHLSFVYRDLAFVLRNQPSFVPFQSMPDAARIEPELLVAAATDYLIERVHLTPGFAIGLKLPATFATGPSLDQFGQDVSQTIVVRDRGDFAPLVRGEGSVPILETRLSLRWDVSQLLSSVVWAQYRRDNNATRLELDPNGAVRLRRFISPDFLGSGVSVQARF